MEESKIGVLYHGGTVVCSDCRCLCQIASLHKTGGDVIRALRQGGWKKRKKGWVCITCIGAETKKKKKAKPERKNDPF